MSPSTGQRAFRPRRRRHRHCEEEFLAAIKICLDVVHGNAVPWELRAAIIRAADEAGITAIAVLH
nr:DUF982 domain-containing protein [Rhizobium sp. 1399]